MMGVCCHGAIKLCLCVYVCVCMRACMCVCACMCARLCMCACACMCACVYMCARVCMCVCVCTRAHVYVCALRVCTRVRVYVACCGGQRTTPFHLVLRHGLSFYCCTGPVSWSVSFWEFPCLSHFLLVHAGITDVYRDTARPSSLS